MEPSWLAQGTAHLTMHDTGSSLPAGTMAICTTAPNLATTGKMLETVVPRGRPSVREVVSQPCNDIMLWTDGFVCWTDSDIVSVLHWNKLLRLDGSSVLYGVVVGALQATTGGIPSVASWVHRDRITFGVPFPNQTAASGYHATGEITYCGQ